ncbi:hypothetical protein [Vibrio nitrifigilis]|uniref:Uncharacterized protein n=1 Tax=Vibrio nitrifigilis TaxID=2789781 RepID=A0ABS0GHK0_9VIBR|nr:hypothetical protein [Vibrio nitrifigilis]MBF9001911.1 hypothetical protein [Vibrio nitrifigilis]
MVDSTELNPTEKQLRDALERLVAQKPTNRELKQKLKTNKLKIVVSNVEKEAGLSNGAAKRYPETKALIENAEAERIYGASNVSDTVIRAHPLYVKSKEDLLKAKHEMKKLKVELELKDEKLDSYKELLKYQAVRTHQMTVAMWEQIPDDKKHVELMIDVQDMNAHSNVVDFKKREDLD